MSADTLVALFRRNLDASDLTDAERTAHETLAERHLAAFAEAKMLGPLPKPRVVECRCAGCVMMRIVEEQAVAADKQAGAE